MDIIKQPRRHRPQLGMTLVELSAVVGILGLLAVMALPNLTSILTRSEGKRDIEEVIGIFKVARAQARSELIQVTLDIQGSEIVLTPNGGTEARYAFGQRIASVTIGTGDGTLTFEPAGGTLEMNPTAVTITTTEGAVTTATVFPAIGSMRVQL